MNYWISLEPANNLYLHSLPMPLQPGFGGTGFLGLTVFVFCQINLLSFQNII
jgi:hypothetical protein